MRILVDLGSHVTGSPVITQVEKVPAPGEGTPINGKFLLPIYPAGEFEVTDTDYVLDGAGQCDGGDLSSKSFAYLLMQYPMFGHVYFNPLLTAAHVAELDLTAQFMEVNAPAPWGPSPPNVPVLYPTRVATGRGTGPQLGTMPTHTCLLAQNNACQPPHPGMLITQAIDISAYTAGVGADEFMLYWKLYDFTVQADIVDAVTSVNEPAIRRVFETDDEPTGLSVYISPDNGGHWCEAGLLTPIAFEAKTTSFRLAFKNTSVNKMYLACFAVLF